MVPGGNPRPGPGLCLIRTVANCRSKVPLSLRERVGVRGARWRFRYSVFDPIATSPHPNPLPKGEGDHSHWPPGAAASVRWWASKKATTRRACCWTSAGRPISSAARRRWRERMLRELAAAGWSARLAAADTLGGAWAAAHFGAAAGRRDPHSSRRDARRLAAAAHRSLAAAAGNRRLAALLGRAADRATRSAAAPGALVAVRAAVGRAMGPGDGRLLRAAAGSVVRRRDLPPTGRPNIPRPAAKPSPRPWNC